MKKILFLTSIAAVLIFLALLPSQSLLLDKNFHQQLISLLPNTWLGYVFFILVLTFLTSIGLPRQITAFSCGYSYGVIWGSLVATLSVTIACAITYSIARLLLKNTVKRKFNNAYLQCRSLFQQQLFYKVIVIRLLPIGSNFLTNIIAGTCKLNAKRFVAGSLIGFIPQIIIFALMGAGIKVADTTQVIISISLFFVALMLGLYLYLKNKQLMISNDH